MPGFEIFGEEEKKEIMEVLDTGVLFRYEFAEQRNGIYKVAEFEKRFAEYCGSEYAQAVSSGSAALRVALAALGVSPGDEVITAAAGFEADVAVLIAFAGTMAVQTQRIASERDRAEQASTDLESVVEFQSGMLSNSTSGTSHRW